MTVARPTHRWRAVVVFTLVAAGVGLLAKRPLLLLISTTGIVYAVYPRLTSVSEPELSIERRVSEEDPRAGTTIDVTTTVTNVGDRSIWDLRLVDGVPPALAVVDGTPRLGTALRAGKSASVSYRIEAKRGRHQYESATVIARDLSGGHELEIAVETDTEVDCTTNIGTAPIRDQTLNMTGQTVASTGGSGTEFYQVRSYHRGDPIGRIDWKRYARNRELTTVEFREEQAANILVVVDTTASAYRGRDGTPHAVVHSVGAAQELFESILDDRNRAGLTTLGRGSVWLDPGTGRRHRIRGQKLLATHEALGSRPPATQPDRSVAEQVERLRARLATDTQLLFLTPLLDADVGEAIQRFEAEGHQVTVISPDPTVDDGATTGRALAELERDSWVRRLRQSAITTVDWSPREPLSAVLHRRMEVTRR